MYKYLFSNGLWPFFGFIDRAAEDVTGNRLRERGSDMQQRAPGRSLQTGCTLTLTNTKKGVNNTFRISLE